MNVNKAYDRGIIRGIVRFARAKQSWSLYLEDDPLAKLLNFRHWQGDGVIANFDDSQVVRAVRRRRIPVVAIGGGHVDRRSMTRIPYVRTDNQRIADLAAQHFLDRHFRRFAYCGFPRTAVNPWSQQRATAFGRRINAAGFPCSSYTGRHRTAAQWQQLLNGLIDWLESLEKPVGVMACNDARARQVLEACRQMGLNVPEDVAVIGVDNDEIMCELADPPLSSVIQGADRIGDEAAALLESLIAGKRPPAKDRMVGPLGIVTRQSTDVLAIDDTTVLQAVRFIREHLDRQLKVRDVVQHVAESRATLDKRFKRTLGRTVHDEIEHCRLERVKHLIQTTDLPLKQVARNAGFGSVQYMTTLVRRQLGRTPGQLRKEKARLAGSPESTSF